MIEIILSDRAYENDVYPLVKAFYPEEELKVFSEVELKVFSEVELAELSIDHPLDPSGETTSSSDRIENHSQEDLYSKNLIHISLTPENINLRIRIGGESYRRTLELPEITPKASYKNGMKRVLYELLSDATNKTLPWGILTGIRPTKLVYDMLEKGWKVSDIHSHMKSEYLCSEHKIELSIKIAARELELLTAMDYRNGYSLYIGIPFCPTTCLYCSFTSYSVTRFADLVESYLEALEKEILYAATCFPKKKLTTVYLGGGTPTTLTANQLDRLLARVKKHFDFTNVKEFCVEAGRPDSITKEKLEVLKRWGCDRISINPQSMQQKTLDLIGRRHTVEEVKEAFAMAREAGHDNINMDIIIGLPGEKPEDVRDTLLQVKELNPESLTVHTLALKRAARLNQEKESYAQLKASEVPLMLEETIQYAEENSYLPYYLYRQKNMADNLENIGYSRLGKEGLYNILIMEEKQTILALGAGAMSKFVFYAENRLERVDNVKSVTDYISRIDEMIERKRKFIAENRTLL